MRFRGLHACRWRTGNTVPMKAELHEQMGKGEVRFLQEQRMYGRIIDNVNGRGVDHVMNHLGIEVNHELKFVGKNPRILTGDSGVEEGAGLLDLGQRALEIVDDVLGNSALGERAEELAGALRNFRKRRVSQKNWRTLAELVGIALDVMDDEEVLLSDHPWFADPLLIGLDIASLEPTRLLPNADVVVLLRDDAYLIIPRSEMFSHLIFKGEVSPAGVPNLSSHFPWDERLLEDADDIFAYTESLYEYVVRYKSSNTDPDTGKRRKYEDGVVNRSPA